MTEEIERIGGTFVADEYPTGSFEEREAVVPPQVLYTSSDCCTAEDLEAMRKALGEVPPVIAQAEDPMVQNLRERVKTLEERDLEDRRQMMDMQERVTAAEGYLSHMTDRVGRCEERCDRMRSAMNLALLTVMASLGVDILVLLYHAGVIG